MLGTPMLPKPNAQSQRRAAQRPCAINQKKLAPSPEKASPKNKNYFLAEAKCFDISRYILDTLQVINDQ